MWLRAVTYVQKMLNEKKLRAKQSKSYAMKLRQSLLLCLPGAYGGGLEESRSRLRLGWATPAAAFFEELFGGGGGQFHFEMGGGRPYAMKHV